MDITNKTFHRLFSMTMYKDHKLSLGEMSFSKDFVNDDCGDLYPIINRSEDCRERVEQNRYVLVNGNIERVIGRFFPYASYEITFCERQGICGLGFHIPTGRAFIACKNQTLIFRENDKEEYVSLECLPERSTMVVSCRPQAFDVYFMENGKPRFVHSFASRLFGRSNSQELFMKGYVSFVASGGVMVHNVQFYMDCGVSQADLRPIRYENGSIMVEQGKVYLTFSARMECECFQGIFAWIPGTAEFEMTGALFYDSGDGLWCGDVAASILFNRPTKEWYLWVCSFAHQHILGHSIFRGDPRFGVNVVDIQLMKKASAGDDISKFLGFEGDEDPDFFYNEKENKWYMAICRLDPAIGAYKYVFFESDKPFEDYRCIGKGFDGAETGGSFVKISEEYLFACGNDFHKKSDYRIYTKHGMRNAKFDFPDGGFRGWGTLIPMELGSRTRYFWITFDRHRGSHYNWSYGNVYCFEAEI